MGVLSVFAGQDRPECGSGLADRVQARAIRSMGELLKQLDGKGGNNQHKEITLARVQTGRSRRQRPAGDFDAAIESDKPAIVLGLSSI